MMWKTCTWDPREALLVRGDAIDLDRPIVWLSISQLHVLIRKCWMLLPEAWLPKWSPETGTALRNFISKYFPKLSLWVTWHVFSLYSKSPAQAVLRVMECRATHALLAWTTIPSVYCHHHWLESRVSSCSASSRHKNQVPRLWIVPFGTPFKFPLAVMNLLQTRILFFAHSLCMQ